LRKYAFRSRKQVKKRKEAGIENFITEYDRPFTEFINNRCFPMLPRGMLRESIPAVRFTRNYWRKENV